VTITPDLRSPVDRAIQELQKQFSDAEVSVRREASGDAVVNIDLVAVGDQYEPDTTWLGFRISATYPSADIYPLHVGAVVRRDGTGHGEGIQSVEWDGRPALQLSRRSRGWNPRRDTAAIKAEKVLAWFRGL